jgi:dTDP-4-amino-4,6-dideoxygalactose transaminase
MGKINKATDLAMMEEGFGKIPLFMPFIPANATLNVNEVLSSRWIGQGPKVEQFEQEIADKFLGANSPLAVGSGTDALHIAYLLANLKPGDEVLTPVFTCTATNIPFLYMGVTPIFVDIDPETMNVSVEDMRRKVTRNTKAIVVVHYGGLPCDMKQIQDLANELRIPIIEDAAHALGGVYDGSPIGSMSDFTMFSFQAIKHITTGDGGLLSIKDPTLLDRAKRLRWFGIDRKAKQNGIWENDIKDVGYKYQMTDLGASVGLAGLSHFDEMITHRRLILQTYLDLLGQSEKIKIVGRPKDNSLHAAWMFTILSRNRRKLQEYLYSNGIETNQVHFRNDRYSIFDKFKNSVPQMDIIENDYLVLPIHHKVGVNDVEKISDLIGKF